MAKNFFHAGPRPKKSAISIYIGPESIEIVQLKRGIKGPAIVKSIHKNILKEKVSGELIREIFLSEGIKETSVITTIPEETVMLRRFSMPIIPPKERAHAVKFEAKRHIPFNINEIISSYYILGEDRIKNKMEILFVAAKKDDISSTINLINEAGLTIEKIVPVSLAIIKSLILSGNLEKISPPTAILHFISKNQAHIIIAENGIPYMKREISLLGEGEVFEDQILNQLKLSASYYKREFSKKDITKLIVCGLNEIPAWLPQIDAVLNIPAEQAAPLKNLTGENLPAPQLEVAIGLASRRLERPTVELDLLPKEIVPAKYNMQKIVTGEIVLGVAILGLVYLLGLPASYKLNKKISSARQTKTACPELNLTAMSINELNTIKKSWQQRKSILTTFTKERISWYEKLTEFSQIIPKEIWVTQLTLGDSIGVIGSRFLILKCTTYTKDPAKEIELTNKFFQNLETDPVFSKGFKKISLGKITKGTIDKYEVANFDISATSK